jgi:hypothetical protein
MSTNAFSREVPVGGHAIPYQREPGNDVRLEIAVILPNEASEHESTLARLGETIGWSTPSGRAFPDGRLTVAGTRPSRAHVPKLAARLGSRVAVCSEPNPSALITAWEDFLARYREIASSLAESSRGRRAEALEEAAVERDRYHNEMNEWARVYGSGRLLHALERGERPQRIYRAERRERELPGFHIDPDESWRAQPLRDPPYEAVQALEAVQLHLAEWEIGYTDCDLVFVADGHGTEDADGRAAVRIAGWLGRHVLFGFIPAGVRSGSVTAQYPDGVPISSGSALRPTAYASAYGIKHPAAQEALRHAAIVAVDFFVDHEPKETLKEYLPPDSHDLIGDDLIDNVSDTLFLVGWKLGQPTRHEISSYAEQIAAHLILREAQAALEMHGSSLSEAAYAAAERELENAFEDILDPDWVHDDLPEIDRLSLADLVATGAPRRASLWAPWHSEAGDPAPRTTGDEEPSWTLTEAPGKSPSDQTGAEERRQDAAVRESELPDMFSTADWQASDGPHRSGGLPSLRGELPDGKILVLCVPDRGGRKSRGMHWSLECEGGAKELQCEWSHLLAWEQVFELLPGKAHPLAVDAVFAEVAAAKDWASELADHVLPGGRFDSLEISVGLLNGIEALREQLERCRRMGVIRDKRLTANGLRHADFGRNDRMRFEAVIRFAIEENNTFEEIQANSAYVVEDVGSLPISLALEAHPNDDKGVYVRCGLAVETVEEASAVANEVISQLRWRLKLEPIDFESGERSEGVGFEIHELAEAHDDSPS